MESTRKNTFKFYLAFTVHWFLDNAACNFHSCSQLIALFEKQSEYVRYTHLYAYIIYMTTCHQGVYTARMRY